ncbi:Uncharacterised protein [BD1-7 clade bacterium]|uniref:Uncharacterized protein n=1 Tax=BD1-7 clade bacterium TaxID=2029982 RepID=A0A5S9QF33_9GAMM|nr:Uncharacterised protein [BD1-7 clade bacterium]
MAPTANHCFVVMGLYTRPPKDEFCTVTKPPYSWGDSTVFCDPWYYEWFEINADWARKAPYIFPRIQGESPLKVTCLDYV